MRTCFLLGGAFGLLTACNPAPKPDTASTSTGPATTFGPATTYAVDYWPRALAVADLNADGRPDLVTVNDGKSRGDDGGRSAISIEALSQGLGRLFGVKEVGSATVWLGQGEGRFAARCDYPLGRFPEGLALADFAGDCRPDLLTLSTDLDREKHMYLLPGRGAAGGFGPAALSPFEGILDDPGNLAVADLNADGRPDLVLAASIGNGGVEVRLTQAGGGFGPAVSYPTGPRYSPRSVALADVDGDGHTDAIVTNGEGFRLDSTTVLLPGQGGGTFGPPRAYLSVWGPTALTDLNDDGRPDLLTVSARALTVRSGGKAGFGPATALPGLGLEPNSLAVADVNGDGRPDLVTTHDRARDADPGQAWAALRLGLPGGGWGPPTDYPIGPFYAAQMRLTDVNADGRPDLITMNHNTNSIQVRLNQGR